SGMGGSSVPCMRTNLTVLALSALGLAGGCATAPKGPGMMDPRLATAAQSDTAKEVEFELGADGTFSKVAVEGSGTDKIPEAVRKQAEATYPGGTITESELEVYAGDTVVHEVEVKTTDGKECEVSASEACVLRYTECKLKPEELAEPVKKAVEAAAPGAEITEAEVRKTPDGAEDYRIEVKGKNGKWYLRFKGDGTMIERARLVEAEIPIPAK